MTRIQMALAAGLIVNGMSLDASNLATHWQAIGENVWHHCNRHETLPPAAFLHGFLPSSEKP